MSTVAILDTSIFVAVEQQRALQRPLPDRVGVSVVTLAELELGVLVARDADTRAQRLATLTRVREQTVGLRAVDRVASAYARLAAGVLAAGRKPARPRHLDRRDRARPWRCGVDAGRRLHQLRRRGRRPCVTAVAVVAPCPATSSPSASRLAHRRCGLPRAGPRTAGSGPVVRLPG